MQQSTSTSSSTSISKKIGFHLFPRKKYKHQPICCIDPLEIVDPPEVTVKKKSWFPRRQSFEGSQKGSCEDESSTAQPCPDSNFPTESHHHHEILDDNQIDDVRRNSVDCELQVITEHVYLHENPGNIPGQSMLDTVGSYDDENKSFNGYNLEPVMKHQVNVIKNIHKHGEAPCSIGQLKINSLGVNQPEGIERDFSCLAFNEQLSQTPTIRDCHKAGPSPSQSETRSGSNYNSSEMLCCIVGSKGSLVDRSDSVIDNTPLLAGSANYYEEEKPSCNAHKATEQKPKSLSDEEGGHISDSGNGISHSQLITEPISSSDLDKSVETLSCPSRDSQCPSEAFVQLSNNPGFGENVAESSMTQLECEPAKAEDLMPTNPSSDISEGLLSLHLQDRENSFSGQEGASSTVTEERDNITCDEFMATAETDTKPINEMIGTEEADTLQTPTNSMVIEEIDTKARNGEVLVVKENNNKKGITTTKPLRTNQLSEPSEPKMHYMFLCAGIVIQALAFQLKSLMDICATMTQILYRTCLLASNFTNWLHLSNLSHHFRDMVVVMQEGWHTMKPNLISGAKTMRWGFLTLTWLFLVLSSLLFSSFAVSYFAVRMSHTYYEPIQIKQDLYFDYTQTHPVAAIDLLSFDAYLKATKAPVNRFHARLSLTLPESEYNRELGVFQVTAELLSTNNEVLAKNSQPCMLQFKSDMLQYTKSMFLAVPIITGFTSESQTLKLDLLDWQEDKMTPSRYIRVSMMPRAGRPVIVGLPELYQAGVEVISEGVWASSRYASHGSMMKWLTLLMWAGLSFFVFVCMSSLYLYRLQRHNIEDIKSK